MNEMTLLSKHRIRNSGPDGMMPSKLYLSVTEAAHNTEYLRVRGEITVSLKPECQPERGRGGQLFKQATLTL